MCSSDLQSTSVLDVMRRLPGVDTAQSGGMGQLSSLFIRGTNSSHVLILVDGIRLNQAGVTGSSDLSQFPISLVQRIEYVRGPRSAVYGSDAIGGVVNIINPAVKDGTTLNAGVGSRGYHWATARASRLRVITPIPKGLMWLRTATMVALPRPIATAL